MSLPDYSNIVRNVSGKIISWTDITGGFHGTHIVDVSRISATTERKLRPTDTVINQPIYGVEPENDPALIMTMAIVVSVLLVCVSSIFYIFNDAPAHIHAVQEIELPAHVPWSEFDAKTFLKESE